MKSRQIRNSLLLVLTALIWGVAFVAQSTGGDAVGPFSFNGIRSLIGSAVLVPIIFLLDKMGLGSKRPQTKEEKKTLITGGICCGTALFLASSAQQLGITMGTASGKAGFLTACYILCGYEAFGGGLCRVAAGTDEPFRVDCHFICRHLFLRCRIYPADCGTERLKSDACLHDYESGVCFLRTGGLDYFRRKVKRQTAFGMCPYFCGNTVSTDAMRNEKPGENRKEGRRQFIKQ